MLFHDSRVSVFAQVDESCCAPARWNRICSNSFTDAEVNPVTLCYTTAPDLILIAMPVENIRPTYKTVADLMKYSDAGVK